MNLEKQVCSLELAKRLKELGVKQESIWYWHGEYKPELKHSHYFSTIDNLTCSAFTVAELGALLPQEIRLIDEPEQSLAVMLSGKEWNDKWWVGYCYHRTEDINEANARAKMLIYLIENKLMEVPK